MTSEEMVEKMRDEIHVLRTALKNKEVGSYDQRRIWRNRKNDLIKQVRNLTGQK